MTNSPDASTPSSADDLAAAFDDLSGGNANASSLGRLAKLLGSQAKTAGVRAMGSGKFLATTLIDVAPRIKVRDLATLEAHHGGLQGADLAEALVRNASRISAGIGATAGAMATASTFAPPAWLAMPLELVVETLGIAVVELKLVAELHEVYGRPVRGTPSERTAALVRAWAERRGVTVLTLAKKGGLGEALGRTGRQELVRLTRRRLMTRLGRNLSTLAPMLVGAAAAAEVNRRATRAVGEAIIRDLGLASPGEVRL